MSKIACVFVVGILFVQSGVLLLVWVGIVLNISDKIRLSVLYISLLTIELLFLGLNAN
jgi:hypothetical protein